jgi:hypothetical protein
MKVICHAGDTSYVAYHPLILAALEIVVDVPLERHPAIVNSGLDLAGRDLDVLFQDVRDRPGNAGVIAWRSCQLHRQVVGDGFDAVNAPGCPLRGQFLRVGRCVAGQGNRPVRDGYPDRLRDGISADPSAVR